MRILFVDFICPKPYSLNTLATAALGGSEATLLRVAAGLANRGHDVSVFQHCYEGPGEYIGPIRHLSATMNFPKPDVIIHMRSSMPVDDMQAEYPNARSIVWLHDIETNTEALKGKDTVCVSNWHKSQINLDSVTRIYNPVVSVPRQSTKTCRLGFFSSPHKGLSEVLGHYYDARAKDKSLELVYANPGYYDDHPGGYSVTNLGQLPHHRVLEEMSKCAVLFYPQTVFPETFGLVMAEANAMGVPVIAHNMGAAHEVLMGTPVNMRANEVIDAECPGVVGAALQRALNAPPAEADSRFALDTILNEWETLLGVRDGTKEENLPGQD